MFTVKQSILRIFFVLEILVFMCVYLLGAHGVQLMIQLKRENDALVQEIQQLATTVGDLEYQIHVWNTTTFYKEKFAREQLQMAKENETIFYLTPVSKKPTLS
jgi:cell division protein FtsB